MKPSTSFLLLSLYLAKVSITLDFMTIKANSTSVLPLFTNLLRSISSETRVRGRSCKTGNCRTFRIQSLTRYTRPRGEIRCRCAVRPICIGSKISFSSTNPQFQKRMTLQENPILTKKVRSFENHRGRILNLKLLRSKVIKLFYYNLQKQIYKQLFDGTPEK